MFGATGTALLTGAGSSVCAGGVGGRWVCGSGSAAGGAVRGAGDGWFPGRTGVSAPGTGTIGVPLPGGMAGGVNAPAPMPPPLPG